MNALVIGGSCLLGQYLWRTLPSFVNLTMTWYTNPIKGYQLDVTNKSQVRYVFDRVMPDVAIHLGSTGSVDFCERNYQAAELVNVGGVDNIMSSAEDHDARIIYLSTNAVFKGDNPPYKESSPREPVNAYGRLRRRAEDNFMTYPCRLGWVIIRAFLLYGWEPYGARTNWVSSLIPRLERREEVSLVNDKYWMPTYAEDLAKAVWRLALESEWSGAMHIAGPDKVTLYELGLSIAEEYGFDNDLISPIGSDELEGLAERPVDTGYDLSRMYTHGIETKGLVDGLRAMRREKEIEAEQRDVH